MNAYVYGLICASLAIAVTELLIPENAKTRPYLKLIFGLAMLLTVIKPIGSSLELMPQLDQIISDDIGVTEEYEKIADGCLAEAYRDAITAELEHSFGLSDFEVGVTMGDDPRPAQVTVTLMGVDIFRNPYVIEQHISNAFECRCITVIG